MTKRMLIDATNAEETRVVVLDGNRLEDFDVETSTKRQLKGNIYLAKVVRVEPSLQAAFVEYGGGRHGFLAFGEIHPDYYQIPVADRQRLIAMQAEEARAEAEAEDDDEVPAPRRDTSRDNGRQRDPEPEGDAASPLAVSFGEVTYGAFNPDAAAEAPATNTRRAEPLAEASADADNAADEDANDTQPDEPIDFDSELDAPATDQAPPEALGGESDVFEGNGADEARARRSSRFLRNYRIQEVIRRRQILLIQVVKEERGTKGAALTTYISLAGRFCVLMPNSPRGGGISRKITSAADRRRLKEITAELEIPQGMGLIVRTAGAARPKPEIKRDCEYLMRLWDDIREHTMESMAPALIYEEASLIKRAIRDGYSRDIDEVLVDGLDGWKAAHDFMRMLMPAHARKVIQWRETESGGQSLFGRSGVEAQLDAMLSPNVQLKSGGYLVINQAEALVAIDVNSGRSTRERNIEETALRTNLEAADEAARQLRLRDLAGLIVIDFIDMESKKHNSMVERRLKDALKNDRARIQVGSISHFGLLEMSRQRLRPSLTETNFITCPHCAGLGHIRSVESSSMHVLRAIEEEGARSRSALVTVHVAGAVAMYLLNHKRDRLVDIEARTGMLVHFAADDSLTAPQLRIERVRTLEPGERPTPPMIPVARAPAVDDDEVEADDIVDGAEEPDEAPTPRAHAPRAHTPRTQSPRADTPRADTPHAQAPTQAAPDAPSAPTPASAADPAAAPADDSGAEASAEEGRRRRRRRRGGKRDGGKPEDGETDPQAMTDGDDAAPTALDAEGTSSETTGETGADPASAEQPGIDENALDENGRPRSRRRGRRGGRRRRRDENGVEIPDADEAPTPAAPPPAAPPPVYTPPVYTAPVYNPPVYVSPVYSGPTPADPFGGRQVIDIFDIMEQQEAAQHAAATAPPAPPVAAPVAVPAPPPVLTSEPVSRVAPVSEPTLAVETAAAPAPETAPGPAAEPEQPAAVRPVILGQDPIPEAAPKRGWWKR